ncbi:hypothetical protein HK405_001793, partial [Cladochytrium tenue]
MITDLEAVIRQQQQSLEAKPMQSIETPISVLTASTQVQPSTASTSSQSTSGMSTELPVKDEVVSGLRDALGAMARRLEDSVFSVTTATLAAEKYNEKSVEVVKMPATTATTMSWPFVSIVADLSSTITSLGTAIEDFRLSTVSAVKNTPNPTSSSSQPREIARTPASLAAKISVDVAEEFQLPKTELAGPGIALLAVADIMTEPKYSAKPAPLPSVKPSPVSRQATPAPPAAVQSLSKPDEENRKEAIRLLEVVAGQRALLSGLSAALEDSILSRSVPAAAAHEPVTLASNPQREPTKSLPSASSNPISVERKLVVGDENAGSVRHAEIVSGQSAAITALSRALEDSKHARPVTAP